MPEYTRGKKRSQLYFVKPHDGDLWYGFSPKDLTKITGLTAVDITNLGHTLASAITAGGIAVLGCNNPKPQRVTKILNENPAPTIQGSTSTFCSYSQIGTALSNGWKLTGSPRRISIRTTKKSFNVGAKISATHGIYVFHLNQTDANRVAVDFGLILPTTFSEAERKKAFRGTTYPRPARMGIPIGEGTFSTFCSYDKEEDLLKAGYVYIAAARPPIAVGGGTTGGTGGTGGGGT